MYLEYLCTSKYTEVLLSTFKYFLHIACYLQCGNGTMNSEKSRETLADCQGVSVTSLGIVLAAGPEKCREILTCQFF